MNQNSRLGGGTFCQFSVGGGDSKASAQYLRYIANPQAVRERHEGIWLQGFPPLLMEVPYPVIVEHLCDRAHWLAQEEHICHTGKGEVRTHYQVILSFEEAIATAQAKSMLSAWMQDAFPKTQAAAFVHTNTAHLHIHVWIAARQTDGRKINLPARAFRQLDERWNRLYSQVMHRDVREHLHKKWQTERYKQLKREGKERGMKQPERVGQNWNPAEFNQRERLRLGEEFPQEKTLDNAPLGSRTNDDNHQKGTRTDQPDLAGEGLSGTKSERSLVAGEPGAPSRELSDAPETAPVQHLVSEAEQAVSEASRLHQDLARLVEREPGHKAEVEREPER